jgi:hypothetical protein
VKRRDLDVGAVFRLDQHEEISRLLHLRDLLSRRHRHVVTRTIPRPVDDAVLPPRSRVLRSVRAEDSLHVLAEHRGALVLLESWSHGGSLVVSAKAPALALRIADDVRARLPTADDGDLRCEVTFSEAESGSRFHRLTLRPWQDCRQYYADEVQRALDALVAHEPDVDTARRLLLWHGAPGTGKTSAVRSLMHAWQRWAQPVVVTDPEVLLSDGQYLRRLLLDVDDEERWQLLVLEDAEALLRKETGGPAMSRLLNLTDGLLGQGLRFLVLITTNESLAAVHPAVVRPGRCLAQVEFTALPAAQAASLLGRPVTHPMSLAEVLGEAPVQAVGAPTATGQYL